MTFLKRKIKGRPKIAPVIDDGRPPSCFQSLRNTVTTFTKDEGFDSFINYVRQPSPPCAAGGRQQAARQAAGSAAVVCRVQRSAATPSGRSRD